MKILSVLFCLAVLTTRAAEHPYDETADGKHDIEQALAAATNKPVLVVFGANWCPDCLVLDKAMTQGASATLLKRDFKIVKVDVAHKDKNVELAASYGVYLSNGIPTVVVLSSKNEVLYATKEGELKNASKMSDDGIYRFVQSVIVESKKKR